jgi:hypothetical protein
MLRFSAVAIGAVLLAGAAQAGEPESPDVTKKHLLDAFTVMDTDGDRSITLAEAPPTTRSYMLNGVRHTEGPDPAFFIRLHDTDGDGRVSFAEYGASAVNMRRSAVKPEGGPRGSRPPSSSATAS